jgi:hypothetical protein
LIRAGPFNRGDRRRPLVLLAQPEFIRFNVVGVVWVRGLPVIGSASMSGRKTPQALQMVKRRRLHMMQIAGLHFWW